MTVERRYQEDEVAEIFAAATTPSLSRPGARVADPSAEGLTLAQLQEIGREVGIAPERIAEAAAALERSGVRQPRRTELGMPIGVGRTVELPRAPTDREWAMLVAELRETFGARGHESSQGESRLWSVGNLYAVVEPTPSGWRLRLGTIKSNGVALNRMGLGWLAAGTVVGLASLLSSGAPDASLALIFGGMGAGTFALNALRLPRWAREREAQMEHIAERARALLSPAGTDAG